MSAAWRPPLVLLPPAFPGAQYFALFQTFSTPSHRGPLALPCARERAPPGGHHGYRGPLPSLEPSTHQLCTPCCFFETFSTTTPQSQPFRRSQLARPASLGPGPGTTVSASPRAFQRAPARPSATFPAGATPRERPVPHEPHHRQKAPGPPPALPRALPGPGTPQAGLADPLAPPAASGGLTTTRLSVGSLEPALKHPPDGRYWRGTRGRRTARPWESSVL